jgi:hypothetical protein
MDHDDPDLGFVASLLSHAVRGGGLTERQQPYATKVIDRIRKMWAEERLRAQQPAEASSTVSCRLADLEVAGEA